MRSIQSMASSRRSSIGGFATRPLLDDTSPAKRRFSLNVLVPVKEDSSRSLHKSNASMNVIRQYSDVKVISDSSSNDHFLDADLQKVVRKKTMPPVMEVSFNSDSSATSLKRSLSSDDLNSSGSRGIIRHATSETEIDKIS